MNMKKKFILRLTVALFFELLIILGLNAQEYDHTVNIPSQRPHVPGAWNNHYMNSADFLPGQSLLITIDEGKYVQTFGGLNAPKAGKVVIQGAGADKTTIEAGKNEAGNYIETRFFTFNNVGNPEFEFVVKDLTLKGFGYDVTTYAGSCIQFQEMANLKATFINVSFEDCRGVNSIIGSQAKEGEMELTFDNCFFGNNYTHVLSNSIKGLMYIKDDHKITIKNCTFMSNLAKVINRDVEPPVDLGMRNGSILQVETINTYSEVILNMENNTIINNLVENDASTDNIQPVISFSADNGFIDVNMTNNMIIENRRKGENKDIDLFLKYEPNITFLTTSNNTVNKMLNRILSDDDPPVETIEDFEIEGIDANPEYTFTHPAIKFRMDGDLPMIIKDDKGVKHVEYGIGVDVKNKEASRSLTAYPNPSGGLFKINLGSEMNNTRYDVYNSTGSLVKSGVFTQDNPKLDLRGNTKGLYILKTYGNNMGCLRLLVH